MAAPVLGVAAMGARRAAVTAMGTGVAAGVLGTWFEMSHGIVCIPVLSLPPLALSQHAAIGSTVFGVAVRQAISTTFLALDPSVDLGDHDALEELVDMNAVVALATSATGAAVWAATMARRVSPVTIRKANGLFLIGVSVFLHWRQRGLENMAEAESPAASSEASVEATPPSSPDAVLIKRRASAPISSAFDWPQLLGLGVASGVVLGFFGIGPTWMLIPLLEHLPSSAKPHGGLPATSSGSSSRDAAPSGAASGSGDGEQPGEAASAQAEITEKLRRTCAFAMVPPSIAAALRHFSLGHAPNAHVVALPLAAGAVLGSAAGGTVLEDVECDADLHLGLSGLLFAFGAWSVLRPA